MTVFTVHHNRLRPLVLGVAVAIVLAACGSTEDTAEPAVGTEPAASSTSQPAAVTAATPTTTVTTTSTTTTTTEPPCEVNCPVEDADYALIQGSIDEYNSGDWDTWLSTIADEEPAFATPVGPQTTSLVEFDFIWSAAMNEVWTLGECLGIRGDIRCDVTIEDDLHRGLANLGLEPSECTLIVSVEDGLVDWKKYDLFPCHIDYDQAMHTFGGWFFVNYRDQDPIDGLHYRGWNQTDPAAGQRAQDHLQIWLDSGEAWLGEPSGH